MARVIPPSTPLRPVCMLVHAYYEEDSRVRREAESLVARGRPVDVFALRRPGLAAEEELEGVRLRRLDVQRHQGAGFRTYLREYVAFLVRAGRAAGVAHRRRHYATVVVHTLPDFLVLAALPLRIVGVPIIIDLHEAMPEFFRIRFPRASNPFIHRLLLIQERLSIGLATAAMTVNDALAARLVSLGIRPGKVTVILNSPSLERFDAARQPTRAFMADGVLRLVYAGAVTPIYELAVVIDALAILRERRPDLTVQLHVYGRGDAEAALGARVRDRGRGGRVTCHGRIPLVFGPAAIAAADIGVAPTRRDPFTDFSISTKIFEYGAMLRPAVASRLPMVERTFPPDTVTTYEPGDPESLSAAILGLVDAPAAREERIERTFARVRALSWEHEADRLAALIGRVAGDALSSPVSPEPQVGPAPRSEGQ
jgi:glycosyltransferase involved in cell wall biosynthesis